MTDDLVNDGTLLWWIGGRVPIDDEARRVTNSHELTIDGSLVCRCGERHQTPGKGLFVVGLQPTTQTAEIWVHGNNTEGGAAAVSPRAPIDQARIVHGVRDAATEKALARHLTPGPHDGVVRCRPEDVAHVIAHASELDLMVIERGTTGDAFESTREWVEQRGKTGDRLVTIDVPPDTSLRTINDFVISLDPQSHERPLQLTVAASATTRVSILEGRG